jgi:hypothetical protein
MWSTSSKLTLRLRFVADLLDRFTRSVSGLSCVCQPVVGLSLLARINFVCCFGLLMSFLPIVGLALLVVIVFVFSVEVACAALVVRWYRLSGLLYRPCGLLCRPCGLLCHPSGLTCRLIFSVSHFGILTLWLILDRCYLSQLEEGTCVKVGLNVLIMALSFQP